MAAGITLALRAMTSAELDADARAYSQSLTREIIQAYGSGGPEAARRMATIRLVFSEGRPVVTYMIDAKGVPIAGNLDRWPENMQPGWNAVAIRRAGAKDAEDIGVLVTPLPDGGRLLAGQVLAQDKRLSAIMNRATATALIFALPLALFAAFAVVRIINARVDDMAETARAVRAGQLSSRVHLDGSGDTFDRLGATLNAMLDRIEQLVSELRIVTDGLAHDLRSPLTRLKTHLDRAESAPSLPAMRLGLAHAGEEANRLLAMLTTALQISRAEAGIGRDHFGPVNLSALVHDLAELYTPIAEEAGFKLHVDAPPMPPLAAHRELLSQALGNLIDNALKYGRDATGAASIILTTGAAGRHAWVEVRDTGPGIPESQRAEALRRFGRLDPARSGFGAGLGLSLVAAVARLHRGTLSLGDGAPGLVARLTLPLA